MTGGMRGVPPEVVEQAREQGLLSPKEACDRLGISRKQLAGMIRDGKIEPTIIEGIRFFKPEHLAEFDLDETDLKPDRDYVLDWALEALQTHQGHIDKLIKLAHEPAQETIKALLAENNSLRKRAQEQEKVVVEVHELYGELLRNSLLAEVDADKERANIQMRQDAFQVLQTQLVPKILENMGAKKFIESFTDEQIVAFVEAGVGSAYQVEQLKAELLRRQTQRQQGKGTPNEPSTDGNGKDGTKDGASEGQTGES